MNYQDLVLEAYDAQLTRSADKKQRTGSFKLRVLASPAGEMQPEQALQISYDDRQLRAAIGQLERRSLDRTGMIDLGRSLAMLLLPPRDAEDAIGIRDLFADSLLAIGQDEGLRLRLRLPTLLAALPWEYLYLERPGGAGMDGFLALNRRISIVRHEALAAPLNPLEKDGPLDVLVAMASPDRLPELDLEREKADIETALQAQPGLRANYLENAELAELQAAITGSEVFHFAGHGMFNRSMGDLPGSYTGSGALALFDQDLHAEAAAIILGNAGVRVAVLGGCETGRRDEINVWSGIGPALVKAQIPAVVAHQFTIKDACAIAFSQQFYRALVGGLPVDLAVANGRIAAYAADSSGRDWGTPVLYLRSGSGLLFAGASDAQIKAEAQQPPELNLDFNVNEVASGGYLKGVEGQIDRGTLNASISVKRVSGSVEVGTLEMQGGQANLKTEIGTVESGGRVSGPVIDL